MSELSWIGDFLMTSKERMIKSYRGEKTDTIPVAPEFWYYYPAKFMHVDMITLEKEVPHYEALYQVFEYFSCEGWGIIPLTLKPIDAELKIYAEWDSQKDLIETTTIKTKGHFLTERHKFCHDNPSWQLEAPVKDIQSDLLPWVSYKLDRDINSLDVKNIEKARTRVGETFLLEGYVGDPFFDFYVSGRDGGFETAIYDFFEIENYQNLCKLQEQYIEYMSKLTHYACENTSLESFFMGCNWSCNSLLGPNLWRQWDKPVIKRIAEIIHSHGRTLHIHFHGNSQATLKDFEELGVDCICPFERPSGGDIVGKQGLKEVFAKLKGKVTINGNVHTIDTLINGTPEDVRAEVREIKVAAEEAGYSNRLIIGTGDQVGGETPEENLWAMIEEART